MQAAPHQDPRDDPRRRLSTNRFEIVDAQVHLNRVAAGWKEGALPDMVDACVAVMNAVGVDAVLIDERWGSPIANDDRHAEVLPNGAVRYHAPFGELAAATYPERFAYLARIDRRDPEMPDLMAELRRKPGQVCARIEPIPQRGELEPFAAGQYDAYFEAVRRHSIAVFVLTLGRVEPLVQYLEKFPDVQFILDHCGAHMPPPQRREERFAQMEKVLALARYPNLALKWSRAPQHISLDPYPYPDLMPWLRRAMDAFGPKRMMWASDSTQLRGHHSWAQALHYLVHAPVIDDSEREWLLGRTVREMLDWPTAQPD